MPDRLPWPRIYDHMRLCSGVGFLQPHATVYSHDPDIREWPQCALWASHQGAGRLRPARQEVVGALSPLDMGPEEKAMVGAWVKWVGQWVSRPLSLLVLICQLL